MKSALAGTLERARSTFSTISLGQKVVIGLLLAGLLLGGVFFFRWITAPTMAPLFSNLASSDASAIVEELNSSGVAYELADGGQTIMVAKDQVYDLRLTMSGKGLPAGQDTGYALLDQRVPAAGHLPAGARGRAVPDAGGPQGRELRRGARRPAGGRGLRDRPGEADGVGPPGPGPRDDAVR